MANGQKPSMILPAILSNVKASTDPPVSRQVHDENKTQAAEVLGQQRHDTRRYRSSMAVSALPRSLQRSATTIQPASPDLLSLTDLHQRKDTSKLRPVRSSAPPAVGFDGTSTPPRKHSRKKRVNAQVTSQNLLQQKADMAMLFINTPITNTMASSREIVVFLYKLWETQLCASYRATVQISTAFRQDFTGARQTTNTPAASATRVHSSRHTMTARGTHRAKPVGEGSQGKRSGKDLREGSQGKISGIILRESSVHSGPILEIKSRNTS